MSEHIEDYSHLVQQVELRYGIDRKDAADSTLEARGPLSLKRRKRGSAQKAFSTSMGLAGISKANSLSQAFFTFAI
jgi:hypothetical protein